MAKLDGDALSDLVSRAASLVRLHDLASAKRLLLQVPAAQLSLVVPLFQCLSSSVNL